MSMERARRDRLATHPIPLTWEIPAAVTVALLVLLALTPLVVQGLVAWLVTGTFGWPTSHPEDALRGLLRGNFGDGLPSILSSRLPSDALMWTVTAVAEVAVIAAALVLAVRLRYLVIPTSGRHGLATPAQAAEALGLPRLRRTAAVIRPDLYGRHSRPGRRDLRRSAG